VLIVFMRSSSVTAVVSSPTFSFNTDAISFTGIVEAKRAECVVTSRKIDREASISQSGTQRDEASSRREHCEI
jgi:hypothetical protein